MAQEIAPGKELKTKGQIRPGGKVLPKEDVKIFASHTAAGKHMGEPGTEHTVHAVLAHKLISKGAAFRTQEEALAAAGAEAKKQKAVKLTKKELGELAAVLGHEPTEEEIAEAIAEKGAQE